MTNFEQDRNSEKIQKHVPKWKKLLSLKNSSSAVLLEHSSKTEENEKTKKLRNREPHFDNSFKIIEKRRKKDENKDEVSKKERKKTKKDIHRKKKQKVNHKKIIGKKGDDRNGNENLSIQPPLEKNVIDDSIVEQTNLNIPEELTHTVKAGLNYLIMWRYHKEKWKFQKSRQIWLLKNAYNEDLLSEDFFELFLDYIAELSGQSRDRTFKIAQDVINKFESEQNDDEITDEKRKEQIKLNRAKAIVRVLS